MYMLVHMRMYQNQFCVELIVCLSTFNQNIGNVVAWNKFLPKYSSQRRHRQHGDDGMFQKESPFLDDFSKLSISYVYSLNMNSIKWYKLVLCFCRPHMSKVLISNIELETWN